MVGCCSLHSYSQLLFIKISQYLPISEWPLIHKTEDLEVIVMLNLPQLIGPQVGTEFKLRQSPFLI